MCHLTSKLLRPPRLSDLDCDSYSLILCGSVDSFGVHPSFLIPNARLASPDAHPPPELPSSPVPRSSPLSSSEPVLPIHPGWLSAARNLLCSMMPAPLGARGTSRPTEQVPNRESISLTQPTLEVHSDWLVEPRAPPSPRKLKFGADQLISSTMQGPSKGIELTQSRRALVLTILPQVPIAPPSNVILQARPFKSTSSADPTHPTSSPYASHLTTGSAKPTSATKSTRSGRPQPKRPSSLLQDRLVPPHMEIGFRSSTKSSSIPFNLEPPAIPPPPLQRATAYVNRLLQRASTGSVETAWPDPSTSSPAPTPDVVEYVIDDNPLDSPSVSPSSSLPMPEPLNTHHVLISDTSPPLNKLRTPDFLNVSYTSTCVSATPDRVPFVHVPKLESHLASYTPPPKHYPPAPSSPLVDLDLDSPLDPELSWSHYVHLNVAELPTSVISSLFDSQNSHSDPEVRRSRLIKMFLQTSHLVSDESSSPSKPVLSFRQLKTTFLAALEMGEELSVCHKACPDDDRRKEHFARREAIAILMREIWRPLADTIKHGGQGSTPSFSTEEKNELIWRWIGLVASGAESDLPLDRQTGNLNMTSSSTSNPSSLSPLSVRYARPEDTEDRVDDLSLFLDRISSASLRALDNLALSITSGWQLPSATKEVAAAVDNIRLVRWTRDAHLLNGIRNRKIPPFVKTFWRYMTNKSSGAESSGDQVNEWISDLLDTEQSSTPPRDISLEGFDDHATSSLCSRTTTALILLTQVMASKDSVPPNTIPLVISSVIVLRSSKHPIDHEIVRQFVSSCLAFDQDLKFLSSQNLHDLIYVFLQYEDLPFTRSLYELFRIRERKHVFPVEVIEDLLRLSIGARTTRIDHDGQHWWKGSFTCERFAEALYNDYLAWGGQPLKIEMLSPFLALIGASVIHTGLASRVMTDSINFHGSHAILKPELALTIADSTVDRVLFKIRSAVRARKAQNVEPPPSLMVSNVFDILPLLRGMYPADPTSGNSTSTTSLPVECYNRLLEFVSSHPTKANVARMVQELTTMINYGPAPDVKTFEYIISVHLRAKTVRPSSFTSKLQAEFKKFSPADLEPDIIRAATLFQTMVRR